MTTLAKLFSQLSKKDTDIAGGKGASLGEMTQAGIPVPPGFVILAGSFEKFLEETDLNVEVDSILHTVNHNEIHTVEDASEKIQALILGAQIPNNIAKEIEANFNQLGAKYVAVRSSATAEDSSAAAWAGQLESFLNTTKEELLTNVKRCWASLFTPRAIFYRFEKELHKTKISVAVVVQKMVESEVSGIAFSVHPVTQDYNQIIIEAGFGLGEAIVSGQITPDSYVVEKEPRHIIDINVNLQERALYRAEAGGNEWRNLPKDVGEKQVLSEGQVIELAGIILNIEKHYGFPCDIEWAFEKGKFYIVQSRPITTLKPPAQPAVQSEKQIYKKVQTRPLNLIDCECWDVGERLMMPKKYKDLLFFDPLFIYKPDKSVAVYYNFTDPKQGFQPLIDFLDANIPWFTERKDQFVKDCKTARAIMKKNSRDYREIMRLTGEMWASTAVANALGSTQTYKVSDKVLKICLKIREEGDDVTHPITTYLNKIITEELKDTDTQYITYTEFLENKLPSDKEIAKRSKGWLYHKGKVHLDIDKYIRENNIEIVNPAVVEVSDTLKGSVACIGSAKGKVKVIHKISELDKVETGDIIVAPMTTPEMIPALKKAAGIVTDEGGITCHAAIVSRELNIPCVIGTLSATEALKDGDLVEVDADKGIVRKI